MEDAISEKIAHSLIALYQGHPFYTLLAYTLVLVLIDVIFKIRNRISNRIIKCWDMAWAYIIGALQSLHRAGLTTMRDSQRNSRVEWEKEKNAK
ncbi:MAG: hypothetical protein PHI59_01285 [Candidatus Omnitrophica bacterium]|nr:hypothetical protein [Candidatus Omnitrophota bacterium]